MKNNYILQTISKIHVGIGIEISERYTKRVVESILPDDDEIDELEKKGKLNQWIKQNNKRMEAICKLMNENNL